MATIEDLNANFAPRAQLDLIPDKFLGRILSMEEGEDRKFPGYRAIYMEIAIEDPAAIAQSEGDVFTQKLRDMHVNKLLVPAMIACGVDDTSELVGKSYLFEKKHVSFERSNPRWVPTNGHGSKKGKKGKRTA